MKIITELYQGVEKSFKEHIRLEGNSKILVSGSYGIGKTSFLKYFFNKYKNKYNPIFLNPVNYSVAPDQDIINYIKYDILVQLLSNGNFKWQKEYANLDNEHPSLVKQYIGGIIENITLLVPEYGEQLHLFIKEYSRLKDDILNSPQFSNPELNKVSEFMIGLRNQPGLYEFNVISQIIYNWLRNIKKDKINILIVDDLDRIYPVHIFRLMNIFSAHLEGYSSDSHEKYSNKFGFDKVILVGDVQNMEGIFRHIYGKSTDFNGYLDKFYSTYVFDFNNRKEIKEIIGKVVSSFSLVELNRSSNEYFYYDSIKDIEQYLVYVLFALVNSGLFNLRLLFKYYQKDFPIGSEIYSINGKKVLSGSNRFLLAYEILKKIFGTKEALISKVRRLDKLELNSGQMNISEYFFGDMLTIINMEDGINLFSNNSEKYRHDAREIIGYNLKYKVFNTGSKTFSGELVEMINNNNKILVAVDFVSMKIDVSTFFLKALESIEK